VQGVGFRPFVYRVARDLGLAGLVGNDSRGAFIEIEGPPESIERFVARLQAELPPLARISELIRTAIPARHETAFHIEASERNGVQDAEITPDVATCADCLRELHDPADRRYRYPFTNCTNCGPRYSIIEAVPYDRPNTTMRSFVMCPQCQAEYDDPADRRFHAQPNACPVCGPRVWLTDAVGRELEGDAIRECAERLRKGEIAAIKGLGGFHLACRADDDEVVARLRERKGREAKPLAVMVGSLEEAQRLAVIDEAAIAELSRVERPIVLVAMRDGHWSQGSDMGAPTRVPHCSQGSATRMIDSDRQLQSGDARPLSRQVAPGLDRIGLMLPYTPLHHLLFAEGLPPLVMTSGNPSEEPLCCDNDEALRRLGGLADVFLMHNREIARRVDDSVVLASGRPEVPALPIRRARGFAPAPIELAFESPRPVLAVGGELKSTVCLLAGRQAVVSEHLGELSNAEAYRHFVDTIEQFKRLLRVEPQVVACDMHPDYAATRYARQLGLPVVEVQHHHAHVVACMAEHGLTEPVVGVSCDGTGYGPDGAVWGCEVLVADEAGFERAAHLQYFPLLGGDAGARQTWRPAAGLLSRMSDGPFAELAPEAFARVDPQALAIAAQRLRHTASGVPTSSLGRLFDAVAFLMDLCDENRCEAQAAMILEAIASRVPAAEILPHTRIPEKIAAYQRRDCRGAVGRCGEEPLPNGRGSEDGRGSEQASCTPSEEKAASEGGGPFVLDARPMLAELLRRQRAGADPASLARAFHETIATMLVEAADHVARERGLNRVILTGGCFANSLLSDRIYDLLAVRGHEVLTHRQVPAGDGGLALGQAVVAARQGRVSSRVSVPCATAL